jgi:NADPH:quinone reductase-like Zn-dependent oxidoreductase
LGGFDRQMLRAPILSLFTGQRLTSLASKENAADLDELRGLLEAGKVTPEIDRTFPLEETVVAVRWFTDGHAHGKVVITT